LINEVIPDATFGISFFCLAIGNQKLNTYGVQLRLMLRLFIRHLFPTEIGGFFFRRKSLNKNDIVYIKPIVKLNLDLTLKSAF
jgi:hypothetical protein